LKMRTAMVEAGPVPLRRFYALPSLLITLLLLVAACGGDSSPANPTASATSVISPSPAVTPTEVPPVEAVQPDGQRIMEHVLHLADVIGPRPAGSAEDRQAVDYLVAQLRAYGYEVEVQEFSIATQVSREAILSVLSPSSRTIASLPLSRAGSGTVRATLVPAGLGRPGDFPSNTSGNIALIERGELLFQDKIVNAHRAGASAVIIYNNEPGTFLGTLSTDASVPAVSISQADGRSLFAEAQQGTVQVEVKVGPLANATSFNVIARPPGRDCETISGGHYDSVPAAPGASDNASGTAAVLEIAMVIAKNDRMESHCFVLFGAEELGLIGSQVFVDRLGPAGRDRIKAMFNYDMVGVGDDTWLLIGDPNLQAKAESLAARLGISARRGQLAGASSDHASFLGVGIAAFMLHRTTDNLLHTPQDVSSRVRPELLEEAARLGVALLESITSGS
jgi:aminopeptidase YwaD